MNTEKFDLSKILDKELGPVSFGGFLRAARASKDLSQTEMAKMLGIAKSTLCDIEKGRHLVSPELAAKIAKKCKLSVIVAVEAAIQDQLRKAKLGFKVNLVA
jgi:DNA-binding XRE family transcriptional regulator